MTLVMNIWLGKRLCRSELQATFHELEAIDHVTP